MYTPRTSCPSHRYLSRTFKPNFPSVISVPRRPLSPIALTNEITSIFPSPSPTARPTGVNSSGPAKTDPFPLWDLLPVNPQTLSRMLCGYVRVYTHAHAHMHACTHTRTPQAPTQTPNYEEAQPLASPSWHFPHPPTTSPLNAANTCQCVQEATLPVRDTSLSQHRLCHVSFLRRTLKASHSSVPLLFSPAPPT